MSTSKKALIALATRGANALPGLYISMIFSHQGPLEENLLHKSFQSFKKKRPDILSRGKIGLFSSLEEIQKFCFELGETLGCDQMNILNNDDYAQALHASHNTEELKETLLKGGNILKNPKNLRRGFFKNILGGP